jgi:hypothetical protein
MRSKQPSKQRVASSSLAGRAIFFEKDAILVISSRLAVLVLPTFYPWRTPGIRPTREFQKTPIGMQIGPGRGFRAMPISVPGSCQVAKLTSDLVSIRSVSAPGHDLNDGRRWMVTFWAGYVNDYHLYGVFVRLLDGRRGVLALDP